MTSSQVSPSATTAITEARSGTLHQSPTIMNFMSFLSGILGGVAGLRRFRIVAGLIT
jgi:putative effector of murein hydrolase